MKNDEKINTETDVALFYRNLLNALPHAIFMTDLEMNILFVNQACRELFVLKYPEYEGQHCSFCGTENCGTEQCCIKRMREGISDTTYIDNFQGKSLRVTTSYLMDNDGKHIGYTSTSVDITDLKQKEQLLKIKDERFRIAMPFTKCGIWEYDPYTGTLMRETAGDKNFDIPDISYNIPESLIETGMVHPYSVEDIRSLYQELEEGKIYAEKEVVLYTKDMGVRWYRLAFTNVFNERGVRIKSIGVSHDITDWKEAGMEKEKERRELLKEVGTDALTGLYNRKFVTERMKSCLTNRWEGACGALYMIDVDDFKQINDCCGHQAGDEFLIRMADCMRSVFRSGDILCRMGGDEFLVFADNMTTGKISEKAGQLCQKIKEISRQIQPENPAEIVCGVSIGIAIVEAEEIEFEELYRRADSALYEAKSRGKNDYVIYQPGFHNG